MIITCTNCGRSFSVWVLESQYEVHAVCPYCGKEKTVEVGLPAGSKTKPAVSKRSIWR